jgi:glycerol-3-phosphate cytidylyltransferase
MTTRVGRVITFGTFDVFHLGHARILKGCLVYGNHLTVGVSTDELNFSKKGRLPVYSFLERAEILSCLRFVDHVFAEESLERKAEYIREHRADVLVMGDDWEGKFDHLRSVCDVVYLPRTPSISTTSIIEKIKIV